MKCPRCAMENPDGFRFCGNCGFQVVQESVRPVPLAQIPHQATTRAPAKAKLVLIKGDGGDGKTFQLGGTEHVLGRAESTAIPFPGDPFLSPRHACFYFEDGHLFVRDEGSINGVYIRITAPVPLTSGSRFLVGEQLLRFEPCEPNYSSPQLDEEGTRFYTSPQRPSQFSLIQLLRGGHTGMVFRAPISTTTIGREENDINFPDDPFISGHHAMVMAHESGYSLEDIGSKNGTFVCIEEPNHLVHGDFVFIGEQLLRVEMQNK
ncbi:MAG: FHA domain-containing protein [Pseudomonadota bacterium]